MIKKANIIGSGNVATQLAKHLNVHIDIKSIYSRTFMNARILANEVNAIPVDDSDDLSSDVELNIICLKDDAIAEVLKDLNKSIPVVHTSGSVDMNVFEGFMDFGILYPLQTFSKSRAVDVSKIPFFIEASNNQFYSQVESFCHQYLSTNTHEANSGKRAGMHVAAVMANNFSNYLLLMSSEILKSIDLPLETIEPLMQETFDKVFINGPENSQTGPAKRNDIKTIEKHLTMLNSEEQKRIYKLMSELIQKKFDT